MIILGKEQDYAPPKSIMVAHKIFEKRDEVAIQFTRAANRWSKDIADIYNRSDEYTQPVLLLAECGPFVVSGEPFDLMNPTLPISIDQMIKQINESDTHQFVNRTILIMLSGRSFEHKEYNGKACTLIIIKSRANSNINVVLDSALGKVFVTNAELGSRYYKSRYCSALIGDYQDDRSTSPCSIWTMMDISNNISMNSNSADLSDILEKDYLLALGIDDNMPFDKLKQFIDTTPNTVIYLRKRKKDELECTVDGEGTIEGDKNGSRSKNTEDSW